jgi:hypothetical protein
MKQPLSWSDLHEALIGAMDVGALRATLDTLEAIAQATGVSTVHGVSIRAFHHSRAIQQTDLAISDIADDDHELATLVKRRWDEICDTDSKTERAASGAGDRKCIIPVTSRTTERR